MKKLTFTLILIALIAVCPLAGCSGETKTASLPTATQAQYTDKNGIGYNEQGDKTLVISDFKDGKKNIEIPSEYKGKKVKEVGRSSFKMSKVKSVTIPDGVEKIDDYAFAFSTTLEKITIPDSVTIIGTNAFSGCSNLKEIKLPKNLKTIGMYSFDASGLKKIEIPKSTKKIDEYAFAECRFLEEVIINGKNTEIANTAFNTSTEVKITAPKNSKAQAFAKSKGIEFSNK